MLRQFEMLTLFFLQLNLRCWQKFLAPLQGLLEGKLVISIVAGAEIGNDFKIIRHRAYCSCHAKYTCFSLKLCEAWFVCRCKRFQLKIVILQVKFWLPTGLTTLGKLRKRKLMRYSCFCSGPAYFFYMIKYDPCREKHEFLGK